MSVKRAGRDRRKLYFFLLSFVFFVPFLGGSGKKENGGPTMTGYVGLGQDMAICKSNTDRKSVV